MVLENTENAQVNKENGWKFELFLHDCFTMISANRFGVLECDRNTEFAPVKNAESETVDTPSIEIDDEVN